MSDPLKRKTVRMVGGIGVFSKFENKLTELSFPTSHLLQIKKLPCRNGRHLLCQYPVCWQIVGQASYPALHGQISLVSNFFHFELDVYHFASPISTRFFTGPSILRFSLFSLFDSLAWFPTQFFLFDPLCSILLSNFSTRFFRSSLFDSLYPILCSILHSILSLFDLLRFPYFWIHSTVCPMPEWRDSPLENCRITRFRKNSPRERSTWCRRDRKSYGELGRKSEEVKE